MPRPLDLYDNPNAYWHLITAARDVDFEDQHFDRKEAARTESDGHLASSRLSELIQHARETISAFANTNPDGGVLVLGVSGKGEVKGLSHLNDSQRNNLAGPAAWLTNHNARAKFVDCEDETNQPTKVCMIFVPYSPNSICETPDKEKKAWLRQGAQNFLLTADQKEQLRRDKHITSFEQERCCEFDRADLDVALLAEFRKVYHNSTAYNYSDEELLYQAGALIRDDHKLYFNNAGFLFFAANPQRILSWAYLKLLRYEAMLSKASEVGLVSLERRFTGPLPSQIRSVRAYFQESGFFKKYQIRNTSGSGFTDQPEFPFVAVDEVVVNAVVHREYAVHLPVECKKFEDAFVVENAGRLLQRDREVPQDFSLSDVALEHLPRNPRILDWFKLLKDEHGAEFVRALSEGTRRDRTDFLYQGE
jgi:predicted HTH transcriptional regulator